MTNSHEVRTDVCVIGAGPAGLTLAREFVGAAFDVVVLESGQYEPDAAAQDLAGSHTDSEFYEPHAMAGARRRQFGGTANDWVHVTWPGKSRVYARTMTGEDVDFEAKSWQPGGGWPIPQDEMQPYYQRAHLDWAGSPVNDNPKAWSTHRTPELELGDGPLRTRIAQYAPADTFTLRARDELAASGNVRVFVGSTVAALEGVKDGGRIRRAEVVRADGTTYWVSAEVFVLACGGVENSQVLLSSPGFGPGSAANPFDNIGRYMTDHPELRLGAITPSGPDVLERLGLYDLHHVDGQLVNGLLSFEQDFKRQEELLNMGAVVIPRRAGFNSDAERALRSLKPLLRGRKVPQPLSAAKALLARPAEAAAVIRGFDRSTPSNWQDSPDAYQWFRGGWSRPEVDRRQFSLLHVHVATEQSPDRENRLALSDRRDALGRRRLHLKWRWSGADQRNLLRGMAHFGRQIDASGIGKFDPWLRFDGPLKPHFGGMHHPMGGTRMHHDPQFGVVDLNSRVHGVGNLFVAGSSVFPTSLGYVNPTLTLVAMSTRLADHVKAELSGRLATSI